MTSVVGKYAARKLLEGQFQKYKKKNPAGPYDPLYAKIPDPKRSGKFKKVKKQIPDYIPEHDAMILAKARKRAYRLDMALFDFMGIRFGWSSLVGLIPGFGDILDALMALSVLYLCTRVDGGLSPATIILMLVNIAADFLVGLIPFVGDLVDAAFQCNSMNVRLLEEHLDKKYRDINGASSQQIPLPVTTSVTQNPSSPTSNESTKPGLFSFFKKSSLPSRHMPPVTVYEDFSDSEDAVKQPSHPRPPLRHN